MKVFQRVTYKHIQNLFVKLMYKTSRMWPDSLYLRFMFFIKLGKFLHLKNPKSFNEKLQWLKLYDKNPLYTVLVDKIEVKEYVRKIIGDQYVIPTLGVWNRASDIDFDNLPNQFVLKCNHDSGSISICLDKSSYNYSAAVNRLNVGLKSDYYFTGREWPYKHVNKRILAEKYLSPKDNTDLKDYKFFCFNGVVKFLKVDFDRRTNHKANYYDVNWNLLNFYETDFPSDPSAVIHKPVSLIKMIELAEVLSRGIPFIRIDFYEINERPYFGEMTFFPAAGFGKFSPRNADNEIGDMLNLFV